MKRYTCEQQILNDIDECHAKARRFHDDHVNGARYQHSGVTTLSQYEPDPIKRIECVLCSTVMAFPCESMGPNACTVLANLEYWESPVARKVAEGIKRAIDKGKPTHRVVVGLLMESYYREWLKHPMFNDECANGELLEWFVEPAIKHYDNKRISSLIRKARMEMYLYPEKARVTARNLVVELEGVLA